MTMGKESGDERSIVRGVLPWIVAGVALAVYLLTLNRWVSLLNLTHVAGLTGWRWQPEVFSPVTFVLTYPLRWLPAAWIPLGLNLFSAACAALTLALLARSVMLLPHDRTRDQRERERSESSLLTIPLAWLPPVMAAVICGLQLTFWEHGTNGTGVMLDLLMFAYVVRCLLEYRLEERESWLTRAAFVFGLGMTNSFGMIGYLPVFVAAIIWLRGLSFFSLQFLGRMTLCGLAGLSLYLLLPFLATFSDLAPIGFWEALKVNLLGQKNSLMALPFNKGVLFSGDRPLWILALPSLIPLLMISIRWPSRFGDTTALGVTLTAWSFRVAHAAFFLAGLWVVFDPPFSGRGFGLPFLSFSYLGALCLGYFAGYFLLISRPAQSRHHRPSRYAPIIHQAVTAAVVILAVVVPAGLLYRNLAQIRATNGPLIQQFANGLVEGLPERGVVLSDDVNRLVIAKAQLAALGRNQDFLMIHTESLKMPAYHRFLQKQYPHEWPLKLEPDEMRVLADSVSLQTILKLGEQENISYLHPSFGYYFEFHWDEPRGLAHRLHRYAGDSLLPPTLSAEIIAFNEAFWDRASEQVLLPLEKSLAKPAPNQKLGLIERVFKAMKLPRQQNLQTMFVANYYSRGLNYWGVELQKVGEFDKAAPRFELAQRLNPDNVVAKINLQYNEDFRAGRLGSVAWDRGIEESFGKYRTWEQVLGENGPYDEPTLSYAQGYRFMQGGLYRQAAQCFDRVRALATNDLTSRLWLAQLNLMAGLPDQALTLTKEIRANPKAFALTSTNRNDLLALDASAYFAKNQPDQAVETIEGELKRQPKDTLLLATAARLYTDRGLYSNAHGVLDRHLKITPNDPLPLINKGVVHVRAKEYKEGIEVFTRLLATQTNNSLARFNRAIAYLQSDMLDAAQKDYELLQREFPESFQVYFGLGEIAYRRKDTNAAIRYYESYLSNSAPTTAEAQTVINRLKELKGESP